MLPHAHNRRVPAVGTAVTAPALAEGTSSIKPASGAEKATASLRQSSKRWNPRGLGTYMRRRPQGASA